MTQWWKITFKRLFFLLIINLVLYVKKLDRTFSTPTQQYKKITDRINFTIGKSDMYCVCNIPIMHTTGLLRKHNYIPWIVKHRIVYFLYWSHIRIKDLVLNKRHVYAFIYNIKAVTWWTVIKKHVYDHCLCKIWQFS